MADTHAAVAGSKRVPLPGARALGRANPHTTIDVSLKLRRKAEIADLTGRPAATMSREELAEKYGASADDIDKVVQAFQKLGLKRVEANAATRTVRLSGTIEQMENAFGVKLFDYAHPEGNYRGRVGAVSVPSEVKDIVQAVFGLDNRRVAKRRRHPVHELSKSKTLRIPSSWYIPSQLAAHYNFPTGDGTGEAVGLLEFGGGYFPSELQEFYSLPGVSVPTVVAVSTDGTATNSRDGAEGEVMLDVE